jgi:hypothetical protein
MDITKRTGTRIAMSALVRNRFDTQTFKSDQSTILNFKKPSALVHGFLLASLLFGISCTDKAEEEPSVDLTQSSTENEINVIETLSKKLLDSVAAVTTLGSVVTEKDEVKLSTITATIVSVQDFPVPYATMPNKHHLSKGYTTLNIVNIKDRSDNYRFVCTACSNLTKGVARITFEKLPYKKPTLKQLIEDHTDKLPLGITHFYYDIVPNTAPKYALLSFVIPASEKEPIAAYLDKKRDRGELSQTSIRNGNLGSFEGIVKNIDYEL